MNPDHPIMVNMPTAPPDGATLYPHMQTLNLQHMPMPPSYNTAYTLQAGAAPVAPPAVVTAYGLANVAPTLNNAYKPQGQEQQEPTPKQADVVAPQVVVVNAPPALPPLGREAQQITCPHCGQKTMTRVEFRPSFRTHSMALVLCVTGLFCLAPLPYCMDSCRTLDHYCDNCDNFIGNLRHT